MGDKFNGHHLYLISALIRIIIIITIIYIVLKIVRVV
jgi:hypothetical protein